MVKSLTFKVKRSLEATTLIEYSVSYKKNQYTITICFWIVSIEQLYRLLAFYGHLNLKMQLLESLNFEIHAIHLL